MYLRHPSNVTERFTICNLDSNERHSSDVGDSDGLFLLGLIPVVGGAVILYGENRAPELWNSDLTQCVARFVQLAGAKECLSVSDELIACVYESCVIFFNVFSKEIENETHFNETVTSLCACSIKYHALVQIESGSISLWRDGKRVDRWEDLVFKYTSRESRYIIDGDFSPQGNRLAIAMRGLRMNTIFIFDTISTKFLSQVTIHGPSNDFP